MLLTDLLHFTSNLFRPPPVANQGWIDKQTMILPYPKDLNVSWKSELVEQQVVVATEQLRGKLFKRANAVGYRTSLAYLDRETDEYLNLDLDTFIGWLGQHFNLIEYGTNLQYGWPNKCFAARLYEQAIANDSSLQWIK